MNQLTQLKNIRSLKLVKPGLKQNEICLTCWGWKQVGYTYNLSGVSRYKEEEGPCYRCSNPAFLTWQTERKAMNTDVMNAFRGSPPVPRAPEAAAVPSISLSEAAAGWHRLDPTAPTEAPPASGAPGYGWTITYDTTTNTYYGSR